QRVGPGPEAFDALRRRAPDLVIVAPPLPGTVEEVLQRLRAVDDSVPIIVAGPSEEVNPGALVFEGAFECVVDPLTHPERLLSAVGYALGTREEDRELGYRREQDAMAVRLDSLVGHDEAMRKVFTFVRQVCARTACGAPPAILVLGETGTGKGALAKAIHYHSARRHRPLVEINCAAIPANLVESELFGHERGAFTGAQRGRAGLFETAHGGTLFLDEMASLPLDLQPKLLTSIEERRVRRIGGRRAAQVDVQVIAAAQPTIRRMVERGDFREDLYHRLNVLTVTLPPLRERGEDAVLLAERFVKELCSKYGMTPLTMSASARAFIRGYHWPGNVRELHNQIERIVLLSDSGQIDGRHFERASGEFLRV
ncbi:MAG: sigma-54-dependent Fis family transcriptional regulator, partial [Polyangiaceae bacterium]|nr:sigma-54-dependent Fis family transcriptional regulator [Polyangiaceae bacterium]